MCPGGGDGGVTSFGWVRGRIIKAVNKERNDPITCVGEATKQILEQSFGGKTQQSKYVWGGRNDFPVFGVRESIYGTLKCRIWCKSCLPVAAGEEDVQIGV